ncbi:signal peptidase I [Nocardia sp. NPDC019395]|uniref:signal peptidase I n=1 Tax=Nocardia sp. NPDC019395 TaxID=3154686 RepID=UPI0033E1AE85
MADTGEAVQAPKSGDEGGQPRSGNGSRFSGKTKKQRPFWQELPILILIAGLIAAVTVTFVGRPYQIPSQSMENTLLIGDRIYVQKISYYTGEPKPGDVVVFAGAESWNEGYRSIRSDNAVIRGVQNFLSIVGLVPPDENDLVKRVIAVGGQTVECCDEQGRVMVDGEPLDEPYIKANQPWRTDGPNAPFPAGRIFGPVTVPEGHLWVMGDNRAESSDSRAHINDALQGTVPVDNVRGKTSFKIWPPTSLGPVRSQDPRSHGGE